jgi:hypothetical protein
LGENEKTLALLEQDNREGERLFWNLYQEPAFDTVRDDPRFVAILKDMRLPTTLTRPRRKLGVPSPG